jgi:hypothetical protein
MKKILSLAAILGCIVSLSCAAETVYKWTDRSGAVHFGDNPVPDADAKEMRVDPARPAEADQAGDSDSDGEDSTAEQNDPPKDNDQAAVDKQQKKIRGQNCLIARQTLEHNQGIGRMYRVDAGGERVYLSDAEREEVLKRSREDVKNWCD